MSSLRGRASAAAAFHPRTVTTRGVVAKPTAIFRHVLDAEPRTAMIKIGGNQTFLRSPADALALIRDVERRFGPLQEYKFRRDYDQNTRYQVFVKVAFKDPATHQILPTEFTEFKFECPSTDCDQPGGVGLEDLKPFLQQTSSGHAVPQSSESEDSPPGVKTATYQLTASPDPLISSSMYTKAPDVSHTSARRFLEWGGFHSPKPISSETDLRIESVFRPTSIDHFRMRCALRRYSEMLNVPNPYELAPGWELEATPPEEDPLQVPEASPTSTLLSSSDAPTPNHPPPSSAAPTTSTSSTQPEPDTSSLSPTTESSPTVESLPPSDQEPVATSPASSSSPIPATPARPSTTTSPESVAKAEVIATKMHQQAKSMNRAKVKKEQRMKQREANPLPDLSKKKKPVTKGSKAQQAADPVVEKPKTMSEKISGFFSGLW
ncbi:hypothetical protein C0995_011926 [Termitomyces sp. Mi166|nr:hypothetical protein C0995_011926 [Termitomyces sp. Mi166\